MHPSTDASPDNAANESRLTYAAANQIIKKLSPDMVENIFKFISEEEVMLTTDIARILSYLGCEEILRARRVSKKWRDAAKMTVPTSEFVVNRRSFNTMRVMTTALPKLQQLKLCFLGFGHKYSDGEDPDVGRVRYTANCTTHDINIISYFRNLRTLHISRAYLNGRYPVLFDFPYLQNLRIYYCDIKFDLEMLERFPLLKELTISGNQYLTGNLRSLRVLKDTLEKLQIVNCSNVRGNFMDLADFPRLKKLYLYDAFLFRDIQEHDFPALEYLSLPRTVHGGMYYMFHSISDVPSFMHTIHLLMQRTPDLFDAYSLYVAFFWGLSKDSADWYDWVNDILQPPFGLLFIQAGSRRGWSWCNRDFQSTRDEHHNCEINWLDPEPSSESSDYEPYIEELQRLEARVDFYRGYHQPPNKEQYRRLCCDGLEQRD